MVSIIRAKAEWIKTPSSLSPPGTGFTATAKTSWGLFPPQVVVFSAHLWKGLLDQLPRLNWIEYLSVLLVAGGSGVSFGLSVLVYRACV